MHKYKDLKQSKAAILPFSKLSTFFNQSISLDTEGLLSFVSDGNHHIYVIVDHFTYYIVTAPTPKNNSHYAVNALNQYWISKLGPPQNLLTDKVTENPNSELKNCCTLFSNRHSPRKSQALWTNGLVEVQNKILQPIWECFYMIPSKTGLYNYISLLIITIVNHCHICIIHHMKQFFISNQSFHWFFNEVFFEFLFMNLLDNNALICLLILVINNLIWICCFIASCLNRFLLSFYRLKQQ